MKSIWIMFLLTMLSSILKAQINLVPNWSFEDYNQCPNNWDQLYKVNDWSKFNTGSTDYWNACDTTNFASVPYNVVGFQDAANGDAYVGYVSFSGNGVTSYREFFGAQLIAPLIIGIQYFVTLKVNLALGDTNYLKYASNRQCVLFTTSLYSQTNPLAILNFAHLCNLNIITDTTNWTTLRWTFTADSSYQYIVLGNFFEDSLTSTILINSLPSGWVPEAYYYVDNVCVSTDSLYCETITGIEGKNGAIGIKVYPNPCQNKLIVEVNNMPASAVVASVYDLNGKMILNKKIDFVNDSNSISVNALNTGMYLLLLQDTKWSKRLVFIKN